MLCTMIGIGELGQISRLRLLFTATLCWQPCLWLSRAMEVSFTAFKP
jgi:hypothetical protein